MSKQLRMHRMNLPKLVKTVAIHIVAAVGKPSVREHRKVRVRITMHRRRQVKDDDNLHGMAKPYFDALVRLGYAHDDSTRWMQQVVDPVVLGPEEFAEIEMERVEGEV
jgi:hypothetical protein